MPDPIYIPNVEVIFEPGERPPGYVLSVIAADLPNAINAGLGQNAALAAYTEAGLGPNTGAFRQLYRDTLAAMQAEKLPGMNQAQYLPLTSDVMDWDREALEGKSQYRYKEEVLLSFYDANTGKMEDKLHALYHNDPMTVAEIQSEALAFYQDEGIAASYQRTAIAGSIHKSFVNTNFVTEVNK